MAKVRNLSDTQQQIAFTEHDFYQRYAETFKTSELGRIMSLLPLREMAISFGLIEEKPKSIRTKRGRKSFFTPEGKVALAFLSKSPKSRTENPSRVNTFAMLTKRSSNGNVKGVLRSCNVGVQGVSWQAQPEEVLPG